MGLTALVLATVLYLIIAADNLFKKDYPHAGLWFSYAMANGFMVWYEVIKNAPKV